MKTCVFVKEYYSIIPQGTVCKVSDADFEQWFLEGFVQETQDNDKQIGVYIKSSIDLQRRVSSYEKLVQAKAMYAKSYQDELLDVYTEKSKKKDKYSSIRDGIIANYLIDEFEMKTMRDSDVEEIWYKHNNVYVNNGITIIEQIAHQFIGDEVKQYRIEHIILLVKVKTYVERDFFFQNIDKNRVGCANGTLNLNTFTLETGKTNEGHIFSCIPTVYLPNATCPNFIKFIEDTLQDRNDILTIQELFGFCLLPQYKYEKLFILTGNGRNGKSKLLSILKTLVGNHNTVCHGMHTLQEKEFALGDLHNKLCNVGGDISREALKDTSRIKEITGQDLISANRKFKSYVTFVNYAKQIFACNELPAIYDHSLGFWNRIIRIDFPYTFYEKNEYDLLADKTNAKVRNEHILEGIVSQNEMAGILNWALEGLKRLREKKQFSNSKNTISVRNEWLRRSSSFYAFAEDLLEFSLNDKIESGFLDMAYASYCESLGLELVDNKKRREQLNTFANKNIQIVFRRKENGDASKFWKGLRFKQQFIDFLTAKSGKLITSDTADTTDTDVLEKYILEFYIQKSNIEKSGFSGFSGIRIDETPKNATFEQPVEIIKNEENYKKISSEIELKYAINYGFMKYVGMIGELQVRVERSLIDNLLKSGELVFEAEIYKLKWNR